MNFEELNQLRKSLAWLKPGTSREIIRILSVGDKQLTVSALCKLLSVTKPMDITEVSRNLRFLRNIGAVDYIEKGVYRFYKISDRFKERCKLLETVHSLYPLKKRI